jgi:hypothetical protein
VLTAVLMFVIVAVATDTRAVGAAAAIAIGGAVALDALFVYLDWELDDPKGRSLEEVRTIRDEMARRVEELVGGLDAAD